MKRLFYDSKCGFCKRVANTLKRLDKNNQFLFSSLDGKKAKTVFTGNYAFLRKKKSIVLIEGKRVWVKANAIFRVFWLLGGKCRAIGWLFVFPGFLINPFYRICTWLFWRAS